MHRTAHHFAEPVIVDHFHVIVKQRDERSPRQFDATIIQAAVIERAVDPLHPNAVVFCQLGQKFERLGFVALVIEHDHFVVSIICFLENAVETFLETRRPISRWDDNGNERVFYRKCVFGL